MEKTKNLRVFFQVVNLKLKNGPDENRCVAILNDIQAVAEALGQEDVNEASLFKECFMSISHELETFSPDFYKSSATILGKINLILDQDELAPKVSSLKSTLRRLNNSQENNL